MFKRGKRGFTLVELLAVVAIIGILMSIVTVSVSGSKAKSRDARRIADIKNIQLALAQYYSDNYFYPKNIYKSSTQMGAGTSDPGNGLAGGYLSVMPTDPNSSGSCSTGSDPSCYSYEPLRTGSAGACAISTPPVKYHIGAILEDSSNIELTKDADAPTQNSGVLSGYYVCTGSSDFSGLSAQAVTGTASQCGTDTGVAQGQSGATEKCYDQLP